MADQDDCTSSSDSVEITVQDTSCIPIPALNHTVHNNGLPVMVNGVDDDMCTDGPEETHHFDETQPYLRVSEQPQSRGFRFRYRCEGPSHGGLQGVLSEKGRKTYPTVQIMNYKGPARIVVTLVTDEVVPKIHAHELVGKNCQNGICVVEMKGNENRAQFKFQNLGIMHVTKKNVKSILEQRILESMKLDQLIKLGNIDMTTQMTLRGEEKKQAQEQAAKQAKSMQLNVVRLCFQAYLTDTQGNFTRLLPSVLSDPIYDSKSPGAAALKICRMDKYGGCCTGNEEVFLLCEKVQKDDIAVRFVELDEEGNVKWEDYGIFGPNDVHRQFAIVFRTPPYIDHGIQKAVTVQIQLKRTTDEELSEPKSFTYYPEDSDKEGIVRKRRKTLPGMGPPGSGYGRDDSRPQGPPGYGPGGGGRGNGPYYDLLPPDGGNGGFNPYEGQPTQQYQYKNKYERKGSERPVVQQQETQRPNMYTPLAETDLETDCSPFEGDLLAEPSSSLQVNSLKAQDSTDSGYFHKEDSSSVYDGQEKDKLLSSRTDSQSKPTESRTGMPQTSAMPTVYSIGHDKAIMKLAERTTTALQDYAATGDIKSLLMVQRHLTFMSDENGDLPLHLAIINKQAEVVRQLLCVMTTISKAGRKINSNNNLHQTPLHLAVLTRQAYIIETLLKNGANPALVDRYGNTPAHLAAKRGDEACLRALTKYLRPGVTQEKPFPELDIKNYEGLTPAHLAVESGSLKTLKALVMRRTNINLHDGKSGRTPLHYAVEAADLSLAGYLLLEAGADVNATTFDNNTALHIACGRSLMGMVALLMAAGANPDLENDDICLEEDLGLDEESVNPSSHTDEKVDGTETRVGTKPRDLAHRDEKIIRILNGEPYASIQEMEKASEIKAKLGSLEYTSNLHSLKQSYESGLGSLFSELSYLDYMSRVKLSKLLDPVHVDKDWRSLATLLKCADLTDAFQGTASPTRALLDHFEVSDGTIVKLRQCLLDMKRDDAVAILDNAVSAYQGELILNNSLSEEVNSTAVLSPLISKLSVDPHQFDSGLAEISYRSHRNMCDT